MGRRSDIFGVTDCTGTIFSHNAVTVTATATKLPSTNLTNRKAITLFNMSETDIVYLGNSDVTTANGYPLERRQGLPLDLSTGAQIYGICESGKTAEVRVLEVDNG